MGAAVGHSPTGRNSGEASPAAQPQYHNDRSSVMHKPYAIVLLNGTITDRYADEEEAVEALIQRADVGSSVAWISSDGRRRTWLADWTERGLVLTQYAAPWVREAYRR